MKRKILYIVLCGIMILGLTTGCGNNSNENKVLESLNNSVKELQDSYKESGNRSFTPEFIQKNLKDYTIINASKNEYNSIDGETDFNTQMVGSTNSKKSDNMSSDGNIHFLLVYDKNDKTYYSVSIEYDTSDYPDVPKFVNAKKIGS